MWIKVRNHEGRLDLMNLDYVRWITNGKEPNTCVFGTDKGRVIIREDIGAVWAKIRDENQ